MPLDPNISLSYQPPQIQNPLSTLAQVQALKNQQLTAQGAQLDVQEKQRTLAQNQAVMQAFQDAHGDPDQAIQNLNARGYAQQAFTLRQHQAEVEKLLNDNRKTVLDNAAHSADLIGRSASSVLNASPDLKPLVYHREKQFLEASHLVQPGQLPDTYTPDMDSFLEEQITRSQSVKDRAATLKDQAETGAAQALQTQREQETRQKAQLQPGAVEEQQQKVLKGRIQANTLPLAQAADRGGYAQAYSQLAPELQRVFPDPATNPKGTDVLRAGMTPAEAQTAAHQTVEERQAQQGLGLRAQEVGLSGARLAVERMNAGLDPKTGQPIQYTDAQGNPVNVSPVARQIAAYKLPPPAARSMASAQGKNLMNQVLTVNPDFDIGQYEERYKTMQDLRPGGKLGQNALALNTLVRHTDDMFDAIQALKNGDVQALNAAKQKMAQWMGSAAPTNFDQWRQFVVGETVKSIRGQGGNQKDEEEARAPLERANSPEQLLGAMNVNLAATGGKLRALNQAVRPVIGDSKFTALDPDAQEILQKRGYDPETMKPREKGGGGFPVKAPNGKSYTFRTQQQADAFKKAAGIP